MFRAGRIARSWSATHAEPSRPKRWSRVLVVMAARRSWHGPTLHLRRPGGSSLVLDALAWAPLHQEGAAGLPLRLPQPSRSRGSVRPVRRSPDSRPRVSTPSGGPAFGPAPPFGGHRPLPMNEAAGRKWRFACGVPALRGTVRVGAPDGPGDVAGHPRGRRGDRAVARVRADTPVSVVA